MRRIAAMVGVGTATSDVSASSSRVLRPYGAAAGLNDEFEQLAAQHPDITKLVTIGRTLQADYIVVLKDDEFPFLERMQPVVHDFAGWTADEIRSIAAATFLVIGDRDFVRLDHAAEMLDLFPDCRLAVLPATRHTEVMQRSDMLRPPVEPFLA